jgi:hypothetical protein
MKRIYFADSGCLSCSTFRIGERLIHASQLFVGPLHCARVVIFSPVYRITLTAEKLLPVVSLLCALSSVLMLWLADANDAIIILNFASAQQQSSELPNNYLRCRSSNSKLCIFLRCFCLQFAV